MARLTGAILAAGFVLCLALNWPGHLSYDSVIQLLEGRTGVYSGWHPPVMSWLLGLFDRLLPGAGLFVLLQTTLLYGSLLLLLLLVRTPQPAAPWVALFVILTPQFLTFPAIVWKDVLFAASGVAGFALLAVAAAQWGKVRPRLGLVAGAIVCLSLAALTRQNGMVLAPFAALAFGWLAARHSENRKFLRAAATVAATLLAMVVIVVGSEALLELRSTGGSSPLAQLALLQTYDLAGALAHDPKMEMDQLHDDDPALETILRGEAAKRYTPASEEPLANLADLQKALANTDEDTVPLAWRHFVVSHPLLYLKLRLDAFRWVFFTPDIVFCRPALSGITGLPDVMAKLHMVQRIDARDKALSDYTMLVARTPLVRHWFWALIAILSIVLLLRRRRPEDIAVAAMLSGMLAFAASFFFISLVCDYRYLYPLDAAALAGLFYVAIGDSMPISRIRSLFRNSGGDRSSEFGK